MTGGRHPWLEPRGRRLAILAVCLAWVGFEAWQGGGLWLWVALGMTGWAIWDLFFAGKYGRAGHV